MKNTQSSTFYIKNMLGTRCIMATKSIFTEANYKVDDIKLGEVVASHASDSLPPALLNEQLQKVGLELLRKRENILVEQVKTEIIKIVHASEEISKVNLATHLSKTLETPYKKLSNTFKGRQNMTIEKFFILQKIERAKALLQYDELSVKEIAYKLGYSSLQHLSNQFKAETGASPRRYKLAGLNQRLALDRVGLAVGS